MSKLETYTVDDLRRALEGVDGDKLVFLSIDDEDGETTLHAPLLSVMTHDDYDYDFIELVTVNVDNEWDTDG